MLVTHSSAGFRCTLLMLDIDGPKIHPCSAWKDDRDRKYGQPGDKGRPHASRRIHQKIPFSF